MSSVICTGIPITTTEDKIKEFFTFCGKVVSIQIKDKQEKTESATITFENESAVSTALLMDGADLNGSSIHVSRANGETKKSTTTSNDISAQPYVVPETKADAPITQEQKPKSRIAAEYLANGYVLSDNLIQKAVQFDQKHGVSDRFRSFFKGIDDKYHIQAKGQEMNEKFQIDKKLNEGKKTLDSYLEKFKNDKYGAKINSVYTGVATDVSQVHQQARKIAAEKEGKTAPASASPVVDPTINTISANSTTAQAAGAIALEADKKDVTDSTAKN